jgi:hypothetical protein
MKIYAVNDRPKRNIQSAKPQKMPLNLSKNVNDMKKSPSHLDYNWGAKESLATGKKTTFTSHYSIKNPSEKEYCDIEAFNLLRHKSIMLKSECNNLKNDNKMQEKMI